MKVLFVGGTGSIGGEALTHCLAHPSISRVVAFVRRDLPADVANHPKLECVVVKDFAKWGEDVLQAHADAAAMIWAMGTYVGDLGADLEYPQAFVEGMTRVLETQPTRAPFRYVHLSGMFVRQNQDEKLWYLSKPRKLKGLMETRALECAENHASIWQTRIVKPGGVVTKSMVGGGVVGAVLGDNWIVRIEELGAFMTYLAIDGEGEESIIQNGRIARKGREVLDSGER